MLFSLQNFATLVKLPAPDIDVVAINVAKVLEPVADKRNVLKVGLVVKNETGRLFLNIYIILKHKNIIYSIMKKL